MCTVDTVHLTWLTLLTCFSKQQTLKVDRTRLPKIMVGKFWDNFLNVEWLLENFEAESLSGVGVLFRHAPMSIRKSIRPYIQEMIDFEEKNDLWLTPTHSAPTLFPPTVALAGNLPDLSCGKSWFLSSSPTSGSGKGPLPSASPHSDTGQTASAQTHSFNKQPQQLHWVVWGGW